jgi:hypothetical protein
MAYLGTLAAGQGFRVDVKVPANGEATGVTVAFVVAQGRFTEVDTFTVQPNTSGGQDGAIPNNAVRVMFFVSPSLGGSSLFVLTQGGKRFEEGLNGDGVLMLDVV